MPQNFPLQSSSCAVFQIPQPFHFFELDMKKTSLQSGRVVPDDFTDRSHSKVILQSCSNAVWDIPQPFHFFELDMKKNNSLQSRVVCPMTSLT
ncbi:hypothetical protein JTE90_000384 [Oedothorax gibbosus]|uniref:Uncharacterized protein n=1 Tax=Oedothorax gibbosus TaxID=931172 RepID=A0AAV6TU72_9ARAC|nr:hypothetical protein JTE90_000384 [Oedothorax gibbosus]